MLYLLIEKWKTEHKSSLIFAFSYLDEKKGEYEGFTCSAGWNGNEMKTNFPFYFPFDIQKKKHLENGIYTKSIQ